MQAQQSMRISGSPMSDLSPQEGREGESENFQTDKPEVVESTPVHEYYEWGEIGFDFYEGWIEDIRSCATGLRDRVLRKAQETEIPRQCLPANRLLEAISSLHYRTKSDAFIEGLGADVVIPNVASKGPLSVGQMLSLRGWFDRRRSGRA
jgi:hypothetical protein